MHETEAIYDEHFAPLVVRLIELAKEHNMALLVDVGIMFEGEQGACSTKIPSTRPEMKGRVRRHDLMLGISQGHEGFDRATGIVISKYDGGVP